MAAEGRAPSYDARGNVRGFRSRPGAPQSANDSMHNLTGIERPAAGGKSAPGAWGGFFKGNSPVGVAMGHEPTNPSIAAAAGVPGPWQAARDGVVSSGSSILDTAPKAVMPGSLDSTTQAAQTFFRRHGGQPGPLDALSPRLPKIASGWEAPGARGAAGIASKFQTPGTIASVGYGGQRFNVGSAGPSAKPLIWEKASSPRLPL